MAKKRIVNNKKERVLLSDVLPYEIPITFTNRRFLHFITENKIAYNIHQNRLKWKFKNVIINRVISLIFDLSFEAIETSDNGVSSSSLKLQPGVTNNKSATTIPFTYKINHKVNQYRDLSIPHPLSQLKVVDFYNEYKELMIYYCNKSHYSIRHPKKVANYKYYKDTLHNTSIEHDETVIEVHSKQYENLRSYFVYEKYSNIYQFYDSYQYHRSEKKFKYMTKLDISKCFDSIYTHSICWALLGKNLVKNNLKKTRDTYSGKFDRLMQDIKYKETNGIVIGPEFSRIFAEHILQAIDVALMGSSGETSKCDYFSMKPLFL